MEINIAWWNTSVSPPVAKKKKKKQKIDKKIAGLYEKVIEYLLKEDKVDLLGLCEVDPIDIEKIKEHLSAAKLEHYKVISLYAREKLRIDDYCLIINSEKIAFKEKISLESRDDLDTYFKIGIRADLSIDGEDFFLFLAHWQSQQSMKAKHRNKLGSLLRNAINTIFNTKQDPCIIVMGDFNDEPFEQSVSSELLSSRDKSMVKDYPKVLYNPFWRSLGAHSPHDHEDANTWRRSGGTCLHGDKKEMTYWKTFDQIMFSCAFIDSKGWHLIESRTRICSELSLQAQYSDWKKTISDHFPIISQIRRV